MENSVLAVVARTAECGALLFIGYQLRSAQLFSVTDAEAAQRLAGYLTLPALILQSCNSLPPVSWPALLGGAVVLVSSAAAAAFTWFRFKSKHKRERALLSGASVGSDAPGIAIPFIEALAGPAGVVAAATAIIANTVTVYAGSYLLSASAGPAFPEAYTHDDGGTYRGEWRGLTKEGLGVYTYASGARYEGEWRNNLKDGRGVYYFPKGGMYEGEWAGGVMSGTGVRTYSSGKVTAGRWSNGQLATSLELWQCATAAEGAAEAALAARRVIVGGGKPIDALQLLVVQPVLWASLLGIALNVFQLPLPGSLAAVAATLAPANKALMLLSAGMLLQPQLPQMRQVADAAVVAAARIATALFITANALVLLPGADTPIGRLSVLAAAVILLSPVAASTAEFARNFRLNETLMKACKDTSVLLAGPLLVMMALAVGGLRLLPVQLPGPAQRLEVEWLAGLGAVVDSDAATMLAALMLVLAAVVIVSAGVIQDKYSMNKKVPLRYVGPAATSPKASDVSEFEDREGGSSRSASRGPGTVSAAVGRCSGAGLSPRLQPNSYLGGGMAVASRTRCVFHPRTVLQRRDLLARPGCGSTGALVPHLCSA